MKNYRTDMVRDKHLLSAIYLLSQTKILMAVRNLSLTLRGVVFSNETFGQKSYGQS